MNTLTLHLRIINFILSLSIFLAWLLVLSMAQNGTSPFLIACEFGALGALVLLRRAAVDESNGNPRFALIIRSAQKRNSLL